MSNSVSSVSGTSSSSSSSSTTAAAKTTNGLTQADFLQLLTVQLQNQDPLNPMSDTEFISQMANFTSLQQTTDISTTLTGLASSMQQAGAVSYLGKEVTLTKADGTTLSGTVSKVGSASGKPTVTINGAAYDASLISSVSYPATTPTTTN